jgi:hypothetical protein
MPIASAIQRGSAVYVYDERNRQLFSRTIGTKPQDGLVGYTATTVSIRVGNLVTTYDVTGRQLHARSVP